MYGNTGLSWQAALFTVPPPLEGDAVGGEDPGRTMSSNSAPSSERWDSGDAAVEVMLVDRAVEAAPLGVDAGEGCSLSVRWTVVDLVSVGLPASLALDEEHAGVDGEQVRGASSSQRPPRERPMALDADEATCVPQTGESTGLAALARPWLRLGASRSVDIAAGGEQERSSPTADGPLTR